MRTLMQLSDEKWTEVFRLRCKSKRGENLTAKEHRLVNRAFEEDSERYAKMSPDVFDATVPFGSVARARR